MPCSTTPNSGGSAIVVAPRARPDPLLVPGPLLLPESERHESWVATVGSLLDAGALLLSAGPPSNGPRDTAIEHQGPMTHAGQRHPHRHRDRPGRRASRSPPPVRWSSSFPDGSSRRRPSRSAADEFDLSAIDRLAEVIPIRRRRPRRCLAPVRRARLLRRGTAAGLAGLTLSTVRPVDHRPSRRRRPTPTAHQQAHLGSDWSLVPAVRRMSSAGTRPVRPSTVGPRRDADAAPGRWSTWSHACRPITLSV